MTLAELQGARTDTLAEEEPGKILHEVRTLGGDGPFASRDRYFGSVDATPLFVATAAEAWRWGALDDTELAVLAPAIERAVAWIQRHLRRPGSSPTNGAIRAAWSTRAGRTPGTASRSATAPSRSLRSRSSRCRATPMTPCGAPPRWPPPDCSASIRKTSSTTPSRLRDRVNEDFWDERGWFAMGLDGVGRRIDALTTNPGHALWSGIAEPDLANRYLDRITDPDMWTGWGLRTLAASMGAYDPLSYHNGSVWPHDTAICAAGAARYGRWDVVDHIVDGALDATAAPGWSSARAVRRDQPRRHPGSRRLSRILLTTGLVGRLDAPARAERARARPDTRRRHPASHRPHGARRVHRPPTPAPRAHRNARRRRVGDLAPRELSDLPADPVAIERPDPASCQRLDLGVKMGCPFEAGRHHVGLLLHADERARRDRAVDAPTPASGRSGASNPAPTGPQGLQVVPTPVRAASSAWTSGRST